MERQDGVDEIAESTVTMCMYVSTPILTSTRMSLRPERAPPFVVSTFLDFPTFLPTLDPGVADRPRDQIPTAQRTEDTGA